MGFVYRYIDTKDNIIKYIGIVKDLDGNGISSLIQRAYNHNYVDSWCKQSIYRIEYFEVQTMNEAMAFEKHYISKYSTERWYNRQSIGGGINSFLPEMNWDILFCVGNGKIIRSEKDKIKRRKGNSVPKRIIVWLENQPKGRNFYITEFLNEVGINPRQFKAAKRNSEYIKIRFDKMKKSNERGKYIYV